MLMQMTTIKYRCGHVLRILMPAGSATMAMPKKEESMVNTRPMEEVG